MNTALNRTSVALLTNKSGGSVAQGDVVIVDSANATAFTTTTSSAYASGFVGVVLEPNGIASNATGTVAFGGYVPVVNLSSSASLGDVFKTHSVAKQAVRHAGPIVAGDFGQVLGTGTTPVALLWGAPAGGGSSGMTDPETTAGDMIIHNASNVLARLPVGSVGQVLGVAGGTPIPTWQAASSSGFASEARYNRSTNQSVTFNTPTVVNADVQVYDTESLVTTGASWHYAAPATGHYFVAARVQLGSYTQQNGNADTLFVYVNGSQYSVLDLSEYMGSGTSSSGLVSLSGSDVVAASSGQSIDVRVTQQASSGGSINVGVDHIYIARVS